MCKRENLTFAVIFFRIFHKNDYILCYNSIDYVSGRGCVMDRIAYMDLVAIPIYAVILYAMFVRKMVFTPAHKLFVGLIISSLATAVCDAVSGIAAVNAPLNDGEVLAVTIASGLYHTFHSLTPILFLLFIIAETRTWYWMTQKHRLVITFIPYAGLMILLVINLFTGIVFTVTPDKGYMRGPALYAFYVGAVMYSIWGVTYLFRRRKMLSFSKWLSLLMIYVANMAAVIFQLMFPQYLVEMIMTAIAELFVILLVLKPEDYIDYSTGMPGFKAYSNEIYKICANRTPEKIIVIRFINATQLKKYFGEEKYFAFAESIINHISSFCRSKNLYFDMYFEPPGRLYIILDNYDFNFEAVVYDIYNELIGEIMEVESKGAKVIPRFCEIRYPEDSTDPDTIFNVGHQFHRIIPYDQFFTHAGDIINTDSFRIKNNMDIILNRAINDRKFEMYYQPIYSIKDGRFVSAEALIRLTDEEFGFISPAVFIPAAERKGLMIPIGDFVLESVFKFISENDFHELGLSYIELNLSVAQCLQGDLSDKIFALEKKYHVNPARVNLEITETTYENIGETTDMNIKRLSENGFSFSLDDYGTGYSNMQRISRLPLKIIKIDKTMVDDMENKAGMSVLRNTVTMMKDINKEIVCEGVETAEQLECLTGLGVDFIQGYYFSKPLPEKQFVSFIKEKNDVQTA